MDAKTARDIAAKACENDSHCQLAWKNGFGSGYLAALEGKEVRNLIGVLKYVQTHFDDGYVCGKKDEAKFPTHCRRWMIQKALAAFNTTTGKE